MGHAMEPSVAEIHASVTDSMVGGKAVLSDPDIDSTVLGLPLLRSSLLRFFGNNSSVVDGDKV